MVGTVDEFLARQIGLDTYDFLVFFTKASNNSFREEDGKIIEKIALYIYLFVSRISEIAKYYGYDNSELLKFIRKKLKEIERVKTPKKKFEKVNQIIDKCLEYGIDPL